jgi:hypothetical protein
MLLGDGLEKVSPPELAEEVKRHAASLTERLRVA